jgi:uncharacterized membrane protein YbaN (DUF454 family)
MPEGTNKRHVRTATPVGRFTLPIMLAIGWLCVGLGLAGAFLPILPTTPFLLLALWAFARSSPRLTGWLWNHKLLGPYIRDWAAYRVVPLRAKILALAMMGSSFIWLAFYSSAPAWAATLTGAIMFCVAVFLVTRPSRRPDRG